MKPTDEQLAEALDLLEQDRHTHETWECPSLISDPSHYGYEGVAKLHISTGGYDWSAIVAVKSRKDGRLFWIVGGGCSCSSPDEWVEEMLTPIPDDFGAVARIVRDRVRTDEGRYIEHGKDFLRAIAKAS